MQHFLDSVDNALQGLSHHGSVPIWLTFVIAVLLGLRHASDPDHLAAVSTMVAHDRVTPRGAMRIGASWGLGHATACLLFGIPVLLFTASLPERVYQAAEAAVGCLIIYFSLKLARQALSGAFHFHGHVHPPRKTRSNRKSYGIGLIHGLGGSYGAALLLLASFHDPYWAVGGLVVFTAFAALSMSLITGAFAYVVGHHSLMHIMSFLMGAFSMVSLIFGILYLHTAVAG